jgi:hypothetical protein
MKRLFTALALLLTITLSTSAMSYSQARDQALFLTDKMAYELNLTDEQYEAAYEINLDYLMRIDDYDDLYGVYWRQRNLDLSYILLDWQYRAYCDASYFYRPLYWSDGYWHFGIYARYPHRDYFFFGCPNFVFTYNGGHSWYYNGGRSWYYGRRWDGPRDGGPHPGMRRGWDNGRYGSGYVYEPGRRTWAQAGPQYTNRSNNNRSFGNRTFGNMQRGGVNDSPLRTGNRSFGSQPQPQARPRSFGMSTDTNRSFGMPRESSTRSTVNRSSDRSFGSGVFGNHATTSSAPRNTFTPQQSAPARSYSAPTRSSSQSSPFGGHSTGSFGSRSTSGGGSFGGGRSSGGTFGRR